MITTTLLRRHWQKLAVVAAVGAAFAAGRLTVPDKPAEVRVEEKVVYKDRIVEVEKVVEVKVEAQRKVVQRERVVRPDGTRVEREIERIDTDSSSTTGTQKTAERDVKVDAKQDTQVTAGKPQWRVGFVAGVDARSAKLIPRPTLGEPVVGLVVERRILGGLSAGVWALNRGPTVGLSLSYEF